MPFKAFVLILALTMGSAVAAPTLESQVDAVFADVAKPGSPGAAVGIYKSGQIVLAKGYGTADLEAGTPITPKTPFHMASVSKQFAAFAIALLARDGKLDLDADVRTYLPYFPDLGHKITTRQLIQHTSGLRDQWTLFELGGKDIRDVLRQEQVVNMVKRQKQLDFEPGTRYSYSNTGYTLLAEIVHAVSGQTLRQFTTQRMFAPLGMNHTFFFDDVREIVPGRANSYARDKDDGPWLRSLLSYQTVGATSLFTTIEDLARWSGNFTDPRVGDKALIDLVTRSGTLNDGTSIHYGFGLSDLPQGGRKAISHAGSDAAFLTLLVLYPEHDVAIAVLANMELDITAKLNAVADIYLPPVAAQKKDREPEVTQPGARLLAALPGTYLYPSYPSIAIERRDAGLFARIDGGESKALVFRKDGSFDSGSRTHGYFRPVLAKNGAVTAIDRIQVSGLPSERYGRVVTATSTAQALAAYIGDYYSDELDITYSVAIEDGKLVARTLWAVEPIQLVQVTADHFDTRQWVPDVFAFVRNAKGGITGVRISGSGAYNVELRRLNSATE